MLQKKVFVPDKWLQAKRTSHILNASMMQGFVFRTTDLTEKSQTVVVNVSGSRSIITMFRPTVSTTVGDEKMFDFMLQSNDMVHIVDVGRRCPFKKHFVNSVLHYSPPLPRATPDRRTHAVGSEGYKMTAHRHDKTARSTGQHHGQQHHNQDAAHRPFTSSNNKRLRHTMRY